MAAPSAGIVAGITTSMPYGRPSVLLSIQSSTLSSSAASLNRTQPSTPSPPARLIAAATCSDGVKPTIGCSMPSRSQIGVCTAIPSSRRWLALSRRVPSLPVGSWEWSGRARSRELLLGVVVRPAIIGLAGQRPRDLPDEPDRPRHLVAGDLSPQMRFKGRQVDGLPVTRLHERSDPLPEPVVRYADHHGIEDTAKRLERALNLLGEDLLAAGVDARVAAAKQGDGAVELQPGPVARDRVARAVDLGEQRRGLDPILVVAERDVTAAGDPADLARTDRPVELVDHDGRRARRHPGAFCLLRAG